MMKQLRIFLTLFLLTVSVVPPAYQELVYRGVYWSILVNREVFRVWGVWVMSK